MNTFENINYGAIYSFEPEYMRHVIEESQPNPVEDETSDDLDSVDSNWSGGVLILVMLTMVFLIASLLASPSAAHIASIRPQLL